MGLDLKVQIRYLECFLARELHHRKSGGEILVKVGQVSHLPRNRTVSLVNLRIHRSTSVEGLSSLIKTRTDGVRELL